MKALDMVILLSFVGYAIGSGLRSRRQASENLSEYFLAGRSLSGTQAGLSMAATQFAADTPLLVTGLIATGGIFSLWRLWVYAAAFLLLGFVLAPSWRRVGVLTDAELSERRYSGRGALALRATKALYLGVLFNCTVLAMVMFAATRIAEPFLTWHAWLPADVMAPLVEALRWLRLSVTADAATTDPDAWITTADNALSLSAILLLTLFYSTTGGLRSVVRTDMLQLALALGGTAVYAGYALAAVGGPEALFARLPEALARHPDGLARSQLLSFTPGEAKGVTGAVLATFGLQWLLQMNADGTGYLAQRCMACRTDAQATQATVVFTWVQIVIRSLLWLPIGLCLLVLFPPDGSEGPLFPGLREQTYVQGMAELLPVGALGLLLTAMLAALASTLDTHLNWGASYLANDLYARVYCDWMRGERPRSRTLVTVARASNLLIMLVALVIMTQLSSIQTAWKASLLLGSGIGVTLVLRWLWWRVTAAGELAAIAVATTLSPWLLLSVPESQEALRLLLVATAASAAAVAVSWLTAPAASEPRLVAFYRTVHPPGFWGPVAAQVGEDPRAPILRLGASLVRVAAATLSVLLCVVGLGSLVAHGTVPSWFPLPSLWVPTLLVGSCALALWLRNRDGPA